MKQFDSAFETFDREARGPNGPNAVQHFIAVLAAGCIFFAGYVAKRMKARNTAQVYNAPTSRVALPRMSEQWNDDDYDQMWRGMRQPGRDGGNSGPQVKSGPPDAVLSQANHVYVVLFNAGTENEGVYTLQSQDDPARTHLLTFEYPEDADRFATMLGGQGFGMVGKPFQWDAVKTREYCNACEYAVTLVPKNTQFAPPQNNSIDEAAFEARRKTMRQPQSNPFANSRNASNSTSSQQQSKQKPMSAAEKKEQEEFDAQFKDEGEEEYQKWLAEENKPDPEREKQLDQFFDNMAIWYMGKGNNGQRVNFRNKIRSEPGRSAMEDLP